VFLLQHGHNRRTLNKTIIIIIMLLLMATSLLKDFIFSFMK